jgi:hypothetical protein
MPQQQQQVASAVWDIKLPAMRRQDLIDKGTTDPQQLGPALKGVAALTFPVTLVVVSKGAGFAVYQQEKGAKDGGATHPVCTMYEASIKYPLDLFLASDRAPDYLLGAELHGNAVPMTRDNPRRCGVLLARGCRVAPPPFQSKL